MNKGFVFGGGSKGVAQKKRSGELNPVPRETSGEMVTIENCKSGECRWPYGEVASDMVLCGRAAARGASWCAEHRVIAYDRSKPLARL